MWYFCLVIFMFMSVKCLERQISFEKNPGCVHFNFSIYHVKADGPNDTIHYIWDFTNRPTIFLALTSKSDNISFNCTEFDKGTNKSFYFTSNPLYTFTLTINKIIEFNDIDDTGFLTPTTQNLSYETQHFTWRESKDLKINSNFGIANLEMKSVNYTGNGTSLNGTISIRLTAFGDESHDYELPKLLHSSNSTQCKIILDKLITASGFNSSRYAIEFILVSSDNNSLSSEIRSRKSLDDENSPGVFSMVDIMTPRAQDHLYKGAFLQWRPIVYTAKIPNIGNSTELNVYDLDRVPVPEKQFSNSLVNKFYGSDLNKTLIQLAVVSLGSKEDGFYKETNYSSWTFLVNYGSPEDEKFSLLVVMVISIGLGLPAILILVGGTYMCVRRLSRKKDELCLER